MLGFPMSLLNLAKFLRITLTPRFRPRVDEITIALVIAAPRSFLDRDALHLLSRLPILQALRVDEHCEAFEECRVQRFAVRSRDDLDLTKIATQENAIHAGDYERVTRISPDAPKASQRGKCVRWWMQTPAIATIREAALTEIHAGLRLEVPLTQPAGVTRRRSTPGDQPGILALWHQRSDELHELFFRKAVAELPSYGLCEFFASRFSSSAARAPT